MRKKYRKILFIVLLLASVLFIYTLKFGAIRPIVGKSKIMCDEGFGPPGHVWIGDDIYLKCDCQGQVVYKQTDPDCFECSLGECSGDVLYSCYKIKGDVNSVRPLLEIEGGAKDSVLSEYTTRIICPPYYRIGTSCTNNKDCSALSCKNKPPKCLEGHCGCY